MQNAVLESPVQTITVNNVTSAFVFSAASTSTEKLGRLLVLNVEVSLRSSWEQLGSRVIIRRR